MIGKALDSRIEEAIGRLPYLHWFDSRNSGDPVSWLVHHPLWTALCGMVGVVFGAPFLYGCVVALIYYAIHETRGAIEDWRAWKKRRAAGVTLGIYAVHRNPWRDDRYHEQGIWVGFVWDHAGDVLGSALVVLAAALWT